MNLNYVEYQLLLMERQKNYREKTVRATFTNDHLSKRERERESRKNANIGHQCSKLTWRKPFKNDEIVISPKRKMGRHTVPLSIYS